MRKGMTIAQFCPKKILTKSLFSAWHRDCVSSEYPCPGEMSFTFWAKWLSGLLGVYVLKKEPFCPAS